MLGTSGMLGHMVLLILRRSRTLRVDGTSRNPADKFFFDALHGPAVLKKILRRYGPYDYIINCIGITKNRIDEKDRVSLRRAMKINAEFPRMLSRAARELGGRIIHISTDGVFKNNAGICFESSRPNARDVYGLSKRKGEVNARNFLNIRCSIIGPSPYEKGGLYEWFISRPDHSRVSGFKNQRWSGVTTVQFALLCRAILEKGAFEDLRVRSGVYHFAPNKSVSKYALLTLLQQCLKKRVTVAPARNESAPVNRILKTRHAFFRKFYPHNMPMIKALKQLVRFR